MRIPKFQFPYFQFDCLHAIKFVRGAVEGWGFHAISVSCMYIKIDKMFAAQKSAPPPRTPSPLPPDATCLARKNLLIV